MISTAYCLLGAVVARHEVPVKYLDAVNFENGQYADPFCEILSSYVIE
ncbi:Phage minor tail protein L [Gilliamella intestini]|uniref:Phage minor tail protein L n=2 Tax=Gilliamella TaxID=1193503 RepID=A0A1C3YSK6_9GAMM|nr:hypothetical protein [Gilliamella intestini]SCB73050.1 Phage minor tail protein L [Gilliamella intestini]